MRKTILILSVLVVAVAFAVFQNEAVKNNCRRQQSALSRLHFEGKVMRKYRDSLNHNRPVFEIKEGDKISEVHLYSNVEMNRLFSFATTDDWIQKALGSDTVFLIRNNEKRAFIIDLYCD